MDKVWRILVEYSLLLVLGAIVALFWANLAPQSYLAVVDVTLLEPSPVGHLHHGPNGESHRVLTLRFLVNDILMALFFALAGKEVWEAVALRTGELRGRKALTPLIATVGGMAGPALIYMLGAVALGKAAVLASGWAIRPPPTSRSPIWWGGWCSAPVIRRSASCCCWPSPTTRAAC